MSINIHDAIEAELLTDAQADIIPSVCPCGTITTLNDSLSTLSCINELCPDKLANRIHKMSLDMHSTLWPLDKCKDVVAAYDLKTPFQLFMLPKVLKQKVQPQKSIPNLPAMLLDICDPERTLKMSTLANDISKLTDKNLRKAELWQIAAYSNIPDIKPIARAIFEGFSDFATAYAYIKSFNIPFVINRLGITCSDALPLSIHTYNELIKAETELIYADEMFDIINNSKVTLHITTSSNLPLFRNSREFLDTLRTRYNNTVNLIQTPDIISKTDIFVIGTEVSLARYNKANQLNEQYILTKLTRHELTKEQIGIVPIGSTFHALGERIFICKPKELIERLDGIYLPESVDKAGGENG